MHLKMQQLIQIAQKSITIERNEFLKVKGSIDTNVYCVEKGRMYSLYYIPVYKIKVGRYISAPY